MNTYLTKTNLQHKPCPAHKPQMPKGKEKVEGQRVKNVFERDGIVPIKMIESETVPMAASGPDKTPKNQSINQGDGMPPKIKINLDFD